MNEIQLLESVQVAEPETITLEWLNSVRDMFYAAAYRHSERLEREPNNAERIRLQYRINLFNDLYMRLRERVK